MLMNLQFPIFRMAWQENGFVKKFHKARMFHGWQLMNLE